MQNHPTPQSTKTFIKKHKKAVIILSILIILLTGLTYLFNRLSNNLAENVARPIEKSLVEAGAVKMCSGGDAGHGPDNFSPWYNAYYSINKPENEAIFIIKEAAQDNGYVFSEDFPNINREDDRFFVNIAWTLNPYKKLEEGEIELSARTYGNSIYDNDSQLCDIPGESLPRLNSMTYFNIGVSLPEYKTPSFFQL
ncbi:MAG: hypothetical protein PVI21_00010 [Candidatus Woesebacteria bacterium]|jgi:hypothetical protein